MGRGGLDEHTASRRHRVARSRRGRKSTGLDIGRGDPAACNLLKRGRGGENLRLRTSSRATPSAFVSEVPFASDNRHHLGGRDGGARRVEVHAVLLPNQRFLS